MISTDATPGGRGATKKNRAAELAESGLGSKPEDEETRDVDGRERNAAAKCCEEIGHLWWETDEEKDRDYVMLTNV